MSVYSSLVLLSLCTICCGYKVLLVFPFPSISNAVLGEAYVRHLMKAGHEVMYITPYPMKNITALRQIQVSNNIKMLPDQITNIREVLDKHLDIEDVRKDLGIAFKISNSTVLHANVQKLLLDTKETFDAVVIDWMYSKIYSGFATVFNCPLIWSTSMEPDASVFELLNAYPIMSGGLTSTESTSIWQRTIEQWRSFHRMFKKWLIRDEERSLFNKAFGPAVTKRGHSLPPFEEAAHKGSLVLGNSHETIDWSFGLPKNYISIAGYHIEKKPLSKNLQAIMDNSQNGVILFSMGSGLKGSSLPDHIITSLLEVFKNINQTVIWKYEGSFQAPKNVHIIRWIPQQSVLAHPNCVLMITSGGLLSVTEAIYFNIPIIGIPIFRDQKSNIERAINKGFARKLELNSRISSNLKTAINEVLKNSTYKEKVQELSTIYRDRPITPSKELVFWIEHVIRTKGALHLRSSISMLAWYQELCFELIFVAAILIGLFGVLIKYILKRRRNNGDFEFKKFI